jgi:hypothetical protein
VALGEGAQTAAVLGAAAAAAARVVATVVAMSGAEAAAGAAPPFLAGMVPQLAAVRPGRVAALWWAARRVTGAGLLAAVQSVAEAGALMRAAGRDGRVAGSPLSLMRRRRVGAVRRWCGRRCWRRSAGLCRWLPVGGYGRVPGSGPSWLGCVRRRARSRAWCGKRTSGRPAGGGRACSLGGGGAGRPLLGGGGDWRGWMRGRTLIVAATVALVDRVWVMRVGNGGGVPSPRRGGGSGGKSRWGAAAATNSWGW